MTTVAAIDCGTNTIKLMVADLDRASGAAQVHVREARMVRLGQDVDRSGELAPEALARTFAAIDEYAAAIAEYPVQRIRFCATSAARDARNGAEFAAGVRERLGIDPEVVAGAEEAALSFDGAVRNLRDQHPEPLLVVDIGGGSTELILGSLADGPRAAHSMDIGSVRLFERHFDSGPATPEQLAAAIADIDGALDACPVPAGEARTVVGVAGTIITVAAGVLGLDGYDRERIDQAVLPTPAVHHAVTGLLERSVAERLALPYMHPGRADVIGAGALILDRVLRRTAVEALVISESDILDGIAWSVA
ncbi:exopolyphosphatase [Nocardioides sp. Bht2]|uniref:Ppx/GppA phosphatase family protein n=1 Tax=Nocardioides sp. Bht2 TaxID=3392297 RepID=UPI0039B6BACA